MAFEGLKHYCNLFRQYIYGDKDLLDLTKGYYESKSGGVKSFTFQKEKNEKMLRKYLRLYLDLKKFQYFYCFRPFNK